MVPYVSRLARWAPGGREESGSTLVVLEPGLLEGLDLPLGRAG